ncbi:Ig-like domain-containing protein [Caenorhabditis elegans]|uniref:Ig-like domain-containing protein n=1 Tax=Caenorhabditis elegans TaxID=6239 RepID=Q9U3F0_CAEEL|nr:Ig-like domain-containing protein [Caenorhabditis elegans]CAB54248.1 Ig-like domain-containing protein [Caenorhabditis elegans]|eukprot:NP_493329.1 Uncharacterized protein CELE_F44F1.6 [Caenorhabditis elegans]
MSVSSEISASKLPYVRIPGSKPVPRLLKWTIFKCSFMKIRTIGLHHPDGRLYFFEFCQGKDTFVPHVCSACLPIITEKDLFPDYIVWAEEIEDYVIFAFSSMSNKMEQFVYSFETRRFVEVDLPELVYNRGDATTGDIVAALYGENETIVIERDENGAMLIRSFVHKDNSRKPVNTLVMQNIEKNGLQVGKDEEVTDISNEFGYLDYVETLPELKIKTCSANRTSIHVFSKKTGRYLKYHYVINTGSFINTSNLDCSNCNSVTSEKYLLPEYSVYSKALDARVIHCTNNLTSDIEQYTFNPDTNAFEQVYCKELVYDPNRFNRASLAAYVFPENVANNGTVIISRDVYEVIQKEKYSIVTDEYVVLPAAPVKTFAVRIQEEKQKKLDEEEQQKVLKTQELEKQKDGQIVIMELEMKEMTTLLEEKDTRIKMHVEKHRDKECELELVRRKLDDCVVRMQGAFERDIKLEEAKVQASREAKKQYENLMTILGEKE